jgi:DNA-binding NtrC family response regulator
MINENNREKVVLVVDDNNTISKMMCSFLNDYNDEKNNDVICKGFAETDNAIDFIHKNKYTHNVLIAFVDIVIKGNRDGNLEIIYTIQKEYPNAEIILITGMDRNDPYVSIFKEKCLIILYKPFDLTLIKDIVEVILNG